ncbi:guanine deaminase [Propioniciclava tarda]|uniref:Guanine deaminase n=1 Tax=Propioniciclava tarda TaxID=433330 RepID=A0A4Q9KLP9_PROTD|nr:guanine deaminase [Propioniciclava tarda]TBT95403.1 guanine deaminase [Propioniciclava tarda]SMO78581.1 guanine deaminase [Propioniciclava tarda]HQA30752.1 guanine deaminase [Propioniciclava tarda]HQD60127.1 guanine deaminase [Propioniciclava tarda]
MTIYRGTFVDCPDDPFAGGALRTLTEGAIVVRDGVIVARGPWDVTVADFPDEPRVELTGGLVVPGFVDTHVHYPQLRVIGALGRPLLEWLDKRALPEEMRLADDDYAAEIALEFVGSLVRAGTTSALVFGSHFPGAVDQLFAAAEASGLRIASGLVVSDGVLPEPLLTTAERSLADALGLAERWHGRGRLRYAVTPRFSLSCSDALLAACAETRAAVPGSLFTSHVNENVAEIRQVEAQFGTDYVGTYDRHGLLDQRSVLAHNVHPTDAELAVLASRGSAVAHCPCSNSALGSGMFPLRRHVEAGVRFALGTDVGAGVSFSLLREGLQAAFMQLLMGAEGLRLNAAPLLWLATKAGASALGLSDAGDLSVGQQFDAVWLSPVEGTTLDIALRNAADEGDAVSKVFALGGSSDVRRVWVGGGEVWNRRH